MKPNPMILSGVRRSKLAAALLASLLAFAAFSASAQACSYPSGHEVFSRWGDHHSYVLGPNGGFEEGATGWTLSGGAKVVAGNESYQLNGASDSHSLYLPAGSTAVSAPICMSIETPVFRLTARNGGDPTSALRVEAVYKLLGLLQTKVLNDVSAGSTWSPSQEMSPLLGLSTIVGTIIPSSIQVRIRPLDSRGEWRVDDLYVDPFARH